MTKKDNSVFSDFESETCVNNNDIIKPQNYNELTEPKKPTPKDKVLPPYSYVLALKTGKGKVLLSIFALLAVIALFIVAFIGVRLLTYSPMGFCYDNGRIRFLIILGEIGLICGGVAGLMEIYFFQNESEKCFINIPYLLSLPFALIFYMFPLIIPLSILHGSTSTVVYGDAFLKENLIILAICAIVGIVCCTIALTMRITRAKKLREILYGSVKAKRKDKKPEELDFRDKEYLDYLKYLGECEEYKYRKKEYDIQMERKNGGYPFKKISKLRIWFIFNYKKFIAPISIICAITITLTVVIPLKQFEIKTLKLMSLENAEVFEKKEGMSSTFVRKIRGNVEQVLGMPTVIEENGESVYWIYYDRTVDKYYERLEEIDSELKLLSSQNKQDTDEYKLLKKEEDDLYTELLSIDSWYRIKIEMEDERIKSLNYRLETLEDALFGYKKQDKKYNMRVFSFNLRFKVGGIESFNDYYVHNDYTVWTRYEDGSFTMLTIPKTAFEAIDTKTAGTYEVSWEDPIVGPQSVDIVIE